MIGETQKHPEWRELVDVFRDVSFGTLLKHDELAARVGLEPGTRRYYQQMSQAAKVLSRDHSIEIAPIPGVGYERIPANRYGERGRQRIRHGQRRIKRGGWAITNGVTHAHLLTPEQRMELEKHMRLLDALQHQARQVIRSMRSVLPPVTERKPSDTATH